MAAPFCNRVFPIVWSDDDWLKKFSGKTVEEAEAEAASGEAATTTQEVRSLFLELMTYFQQTSSFTHKYAFRKNRHDSSEA